MAETQRLSRTIWIGVGLLIIICCLAVVSSRIQSASRPRLPVIGPVADFVLTNQENQVVTLADLRGRVWVADIVFTRCAGPCPRMTRQMESLQAAIPQDSTAKLVTLTTDPDNDSPAVLKNYATRFNADPGRWTFLTGSKSQIAGLAIDSLKLTAVEKKPEERTDADDLFIHSTIFVVVDKQAQLRAVFETGGEGIAWTNVQSSIVGTIKQLERER
jgi:protein SCO1